MDLIVVLTEDLSFLAPVLGASGAYNSEGKLVGLAGGFAGCFLVLGGRGGAGCIAEWNPECSEVPAKMSSIVEEVGGELGGDECLAGVNGESAAEGGSEVGLERGGRGGSSATSKDEGEIGLNTSEPWGLDSLSRWWILPLLGREEGVWDDGAAKMLLQSSFISFASLSSFTSIALLKLALTVWEVSLGGTSSGAD